MSNRMRKRGAVAEVLAERYLRRRCGYSVVTRNWRYKYGEIDLVCRDGNILVFVEVRARSAQALVPGYHSITRHKKQVLQRTCRHYLRQLHGVACSYRFDVLEVSLGKTKNSRYHLYQNISIFSNN